MNEKVNKSMGNLVNTLLDYTNELIEADNDLLVTTQLDIISGITQNMKRLFDMGIGISGEIPEDNKKENPEVKVGEE